MLSRVLICANPIDPARGGGGFEDSKKSGDSRKRDGEKRRFDGRDAEVDRSREKKREREKDRFAGFRKNTSKRIHEYG